MLLHQAQSVSIFTAWSHANAKFNNDNDNMCLHPENRLATRHFLSLVVCTSRKLKPSILTAGCK